MAFNIKLVSHSKLVRHLKLNRDVTNEIIRRLDVSDEIQNELDDAETKVGDLEAEINSVIETLKALI